jgi:hypothetical protein
MSQTTHEQAMMGLKRAIEIAKSADSKPAAPESIDAILDRAFLAPRIVNERAYEDWSERLKELMHSAREERRLLADDIATLRSLSETLRASDNSLTGKIDLAAKAVPAIEQRMSRAEQALVRAATEAAEQVRRLEAAKDRRFEIDRVRIEGLIETIATQVITQLSTKLSEAHEQRMGEAGAAAHAALEDALRSTTDESARIQSRAVQMISRELARIDKVKESASHDIRELVSGEIGKLRSDAEAAISRAEATANQSAIFSQGAIAGIETATTNALKVFERRTEEMRELIDTRSVTLETQVSEFTRFVSDQSKGFDRHHESIAAMILEHSSRLSEQLNQFATEARIGVEELTRTRTESIDVIRRRADVEYRHIETLLSGSESKLSEARSNAVESIESANVAAIEQLKAIASQAGGEIGERLREEADALSTGMRQSGTELRELRDDTTRSLTKAAVAIGTLTQESKETIRNCARVAIEKADQELKSRAITDQAAIKESCSEAEIARNELSAAIDRASAFDSGALEHAAADAQQAATRAVHAAGLLNGAVARAEALHAEVDALMRELVELRRQAEALRKRESKSRE